MAKALLAAAFLLVAQVPHVEVADYGVCDFDGVLSSELVVSAQVSTTIPTAMTPTGTSQTIDWSAGNFQILDLGSATGDVTLTFSGSRSGAAYLLEIIQGSPARDVVWPASVLTESGSAISLSTVNDSIDLVSCAYDGTHHLCNAAGVGYQ